MQDLTRVPLTGSWGRIRSRLSARGKPRRDWRRTDCVVATAGKAARITRIPFRQSDVKRVFVTSNDAQTLRKVKIFVARKGASVAVVERKDQISAIPCNGQREDVVPLSSADDQSSMPRSGPIFRLSAGSDNNIPNFRLIFGASGAADTTVASPDGVFLIGSASRSARRFHQQHQGLPPDQLSCHPPPDTKCHRNGWPRSSRRVSRKRAPISEIV